MYKLPEFFLTLFQSPIGTQKTELAKQIYEYRKITFQSPIGTQKTRILLLSFSFCYFVSIPYRYTKNVTVRVREVSAEEGFNPL